VAKQAAGRHKLGPDHDVAASDRVFAENARESGTYLELDPQSGANTIYLERSKERSQTKTTTKRVVIADDHAVSRRGVAAFLETFDDIEVVGQVSSGNDAVRTAAEESADVVIMDIEMPELDGIEATRRLKDKCPDAQVIILSVRDDAEAIIDAIDAGASGYVSKASDLSELRLALDSEHSDGVILGPKVASRIVATLSNGGFRPSSRRGHLSGLTTRERQVAGLLTDGFTARAIASRLGISERTVNTHIGSLYRRLGVNNRVDAVRAVMRLGLAGVRH
jgi:DNA-binding NarL/FixJ family response regulator